MATEKKHIAVYLDPAVERALITFCEQKGLKSKKGTMFSAGVNAALAQFFGIADTTQSNIPQDMGNTSNQLSNTPQDTDNIPQDTDNIPQDTDNIPQDTDNIPQDTDNIP